MAMKPWHRKLLKDLQGHRWVRSVSEWVIRRTNSKTVTAWLVIDLLISVGLGLYYFFFKYVSALGWAPFQFMLKNKFFIVLAGFRASCTLWGIYSVLFRNVRQVKLFYSVFILNLFVAAWLMIPILSLHCKCSSYYQCEALQSFALDGMSLNRFPEPRNFPDRKVPYEEEPRINEEILDVPVASTSKVTDVATVQTDVKPTEKPQKTGEVGVQADFPEKEVEDGKKLAELTQEKGGSRGSLIEAEAQGTFNDSLDAMLGHRMVPKKRHRPEATLLQIDSTDGKSLANRVRGGPEPETEKTAEVDEKTSKEALDIRSEKDLKVLSYFDPVGSQAKLVSYRGVEGRICEKDKKKVELWESDRSRMKDMSEGKDLEEHDASFIKTIYACIAEDACAGIFWEVRKNQDETYNSMACTLIGPVSFPNKGEEETASLSLFFRKNTAAVKDLVREQNRKTKLMTKIFSAQSEAEAVEYTYKLYSNSCRCDEKGCRSFTQSEGSEVGWCYIDDKTRDFCTAAEKQVFLDDEKRPWTRSICHEAETYERSCRCSGIGMLPPFGLKVDPALASSEPNNYGSSCQKWGTEDEFKWCFVGWDSGCVDRRRMDSVLNKKYKGLEHPVPAQYWSELACDIEEPNPRLLGAADSCENLEYLADGVCLLHLALTVPMIMVLYNYIGNQCGDDIQMIQQFNVNSSSDEEEEQEQEKERPSTDEPREATSKEGGGDS